MAVMTWCRFLHYWPFVRADGFPSQEPVMQAMMLTSTVVEQAAKLPLVWDALTFMGRHFNVGMCRWVEVTFDMTVHRSSLQLWWTPFEHLISTRHLTLSQSPCAALTAGICLPSGLCKGTVSGACKNDEIPTVHVRPWLPRIQWSLCASQSIFRLANHRADNTSQWEARFHNPLAVHQP